MAVASQDLPKVACEGANISSLAADDLEIGLIVIDFREFETFDENRPGLQVWRVSAARQLPPERC